MHDRNALVLGLLVVSTSATVANAARLQKTRLKSAREDLPIEDIGDEEPLQLLTNQPRYGRRSLIHETAAGAPTAAPTEWQLSEDWWTDNNPPPNNIQGSDGEYRTTPSAAAAAGGGGAVGGCQNCLQRYPYFHLQTAHLCPATCYQYAPMSTGGGNQSPPSAASNGNVAGTTDSDSYRNSGAGIDQSMCGCVQVFTSPNSLCPGHCFQAYPSAYGGQQVPPLPSALQKPAGKGKGKGNSAQAYENSWNGQTTNGDTYGGTGSSTHGGGYGGMHGGTGAGTGDFRNSAAYEGCWDCIETYDDPTMGLCPAYCYEASRFAPAPAPYPSYTAYYPAPSPTYGGGYNAQPYPSPGYYQPYQDHKPPTYMCETCIPNCPSSCRGGGLIHLAPSPWYNGIHPSKPTWNWGTPSPTQSAAPSSMPSPSPTGVPTPSPSDEPSSTPTGTPSCAPSSFPSVAPSRYPSAHPSSMPSRFPSSAPSRYPSAAPSSLPSRHPSRSPSASPSWMPTDGPTSAPTISHQPSTSSSPSNQPSVSNMPTTRSIKTMQHRDGDSSTTSTTGTTIATGKTGKSDSTETSSTTDRTSGSRDEAGDDTSTTGTTDTSGTSDSALTSSTTGSKTKPKSNETGRRRRLAQDGDEKKKKSKITEENVPKTDESNAEQKATRTAENKSKRPDDPKYHTEREHRVACQTCTDVWSYDAYYDMWFNAYYQKWYSVYYDQYYANIDLYYENPWGDGHSGGGGGGGGEVVLRVQRSPRRAKRRANRVVAAKVRAGPLALAILPRQRAVPSRLVQAVQVSVPVPVPDPAVATALILDPKSDVMKIITLLRSTIRAATEVPIEIRALVL